MPNFWCIIPYFNPSGYSSLLNNYYFSKRQLEQQKVNALTVELTFNNKRKELSGDYVFHLNAKSIMWQKERIINYGLSLLPKDCHYFAWLDCDVVFSDDDWANKAVDKLTRNDVIQLYGRAFYLPKGDRRLTGYQRPFMYGIVRQRNFNMESWLWLRQKSYIPFAAPGFAWAARRDALPHGLYDKSIVGSGDTFFVDCLLDSWSLHGHRTKFTSKMKEDMENWAKQLGKKKVDYVDVDVFHLWHGDIKNRQYSDRHKILLENDFDPNVDIRLENNVYEWASDKKDMHSRIISYFYRRQEDHQKHKPTIVDCY